MDTEQPYHDYYQYPDPSFHQVEGRFCQPPPPKAVHCNASYFEPLPSYGSSPTQQLTPTCDRTYLPHEVSEDSPQPRQPRSRRVKDSKPNSSAPFGVFKATVSNGRKPSNISVRSRTMHDRLAAVNGVVIPSKNPPGTKPVIQISQAVDTDYLPYTCPICKSLYGTPAHVKSHFPACVERNGNPTGARWDNDMDPQTPGRRGPKPGYMQERGKIPGKQKKIAKGP